MSSNLSVYQKIIHHKTYAREKGKRLEFFDETVDRYIKFLKKKFKNNKVILNELDTCGKYFKNQDIAGSMRLFFSAGKAVDVENAMAFNCKYQLVNSTKDFADLLYSLLCTCGVGISVEKHNTTELPNLPAELLPYTKDGAIEVEDSREGWAVALHSFIDGIFHGKIYPIDVSRVRGYGVPLKTSGGFASGPEPLIAMCDFIRDLFFKRINLGELRLRTIDCYDIACKIADCAIQGGVRRAALIALFDEEDDEMLHSKSKENLLNNPHRYNSNNTVVYRGNKERLNYIFEFIKVNGEPGILFLDNFMEKITKLGRTSKRGFGPNPCFEILLRVNSFCNLVEMVCRPGHSLENDIRKVRYATILSMAQATLTDYGYISEEAKINQEDDPIVGVSLTGLCDCEEYTSPDASYRVSTLRKVVNDTVDKFWKIVGLKCRPKAVTCIKPSGTVSQLMSCSSGVHPRYAKYFRRNILIEETKDLCEKLVKMNVPYKKIGKCKLFGFAFKSPENSLTMDQCPAQRQMDYVHMLMENWCDHNVSCTLYVKKDEWGAVIERLLNDNHKFIGLSFLPEEIATNTSGFAYLPYEKITKKEFEKYPQIKEEMWEKLMKTDNQHNESREFACSGGSCSVA